MPETQRTDPNHGPTAHQTPRDDQSLRNALSRAAPMVRGYLFGMCGDWNDADDLAQESLLKAWRKRQSFDGRASVKTWLYTIARNTWRDRLRRRKTAPNHEGLVEQMQLPTPEPAPDAVLSRGELGAALTAAVRRLPSDQREALALRESEGLTFREIGEMLNVPTATVKSRVRYALLKLAEDLKPFATELRA